MHIFFIHQQNKIPPLHLKTCFWLMLEVVVHHCDSTPSRLHQHGWFYFRSNTGLVIPAEGHHNLNIGEIGVRGF